jgi:hypothetical protein
VVCVSAWPLANDRWHAGVVSTGFTREPRLLSLPTSLSPAQVNDVMRAYSSSNARMSASVGPRAHGP